MTGKTVSHYKVGQRLGAGGMGEVFQAEDLKLGRQVALKFLPVDLVGDPQAAKRFLWEARSLSALNHPNICIIYEVAEHEGRPFIAMELIEGRALNSIISGRPLATDLILTLATEIAEGLDVAHQQGLLHRDIKPANILVTRRKQAKILDFGLAKIAHDMQYHAVTGGPAVHAARDLTTTAGTTMGTVAYMSPEQARGEELDRRSDLFSFGLVLYEMATGRQTFTGNTTAVVFDGILNWAPIPAGQLNPDLPAELERIISKALEKDRDLRYQSASDLRADLQRLQRECASGRRVVSSGAMQTLRDSGALPPSSAAVPVAPPATAAAHAIAAVPSAPRAPSAEAAAIPTKPPFQRLVTAWVAAGVAVVLLGAGAWIAWRFLPRVSRPASQPPVTNVTPASPATTAPAPTRDPARDAAGRSLPAPAPRADVAGAAAVPRAVAPPAAATREIERELSDAREKIDARQFDQAIAGLRVLLDGHAGSGRAPDAMLLLGRAQELAGQSGEAMATYVAFRSRYKGNAGMPDATFRLGQLTAAQTGRDDEAIRLYTEVATEYPKSPRAPEALFAKAGIQDRLKLRLFDSTLSVTVPASLLTYRTLTDRYPAAVLTEHALFRLGNMYDDLKQYSLAAQEFEKLGASFPQSRYDGWFRAAELYDRRLKDQDKARAAYLRVPPSSPRYKDAQKRAGR